MTKSRLHHYCQNIKRGYLNEVVEMYKLLGFDVVYTPPEGDWIMVGQPDLHFSIQIAQVDDIPEKDLDIKKRTHIAFISDNPQEILNKIKKWAEINNIKYREGGWSDIERYFDLPDIFINFVAEVMHTSIEES